MVKGIDNKTTIVPKVCRRTSLSNFEARYTLLTLIFKIIALAMKRMSLNLCKSVCLELTSFSLVIFDFYLIVIVLKKKHLLNS